MFGVMKITETTEENENKLFAGGLPYSQSDNAIAAGFSAVGQVIDVHVFRKEDPSRGVFSTMREFGHAFVLDLRKGLGLWESVALGASASGVGAEVQSRGRKGGNALYSS